MANSNRKNFLFFTKEGFTSDSKNKDIQNMQILGSGMGKNFNEAFKDFKKNQSYLFSFDYENVIAVQTISEFITDLKLKGGK